MNDDFGCEDIYKLYLVNNVNSASSSYEFWKILGSIWSLQKKKREEEEEENIYKRRNKLRRGKTEKEQKGKKFICRWQ